jgi:hypothetical protein
MILSSINDSSILLKRLLERLRSKQNEIDTVLRSDTRDCGEVIRGCTVSEELYDMLSTQLLICQVNDPKEVEKRLRMMKILSPRSVEYCQH